MTAVLVALGRRAASAGAVVTAARRWATGATAVLVVPAASVEVTGGPVEPAEMLSGSATAEPEAPAGSPTLMEVPAAPGVTVGMAGLSPVMAVTGVAEPPGVPTVG